MSSNDVSIGVVGLGNIGHYHADRLTELGANIAGGIDIDPDARAEFGAKYNVPTYDEHDELYDAADAVIITTPNKFHESYAVDALNDGLDVLLEKPLAHSVESAERIAAAAQNSEGFCMVGFHSRFHHQIQIIKEEQAAGTFGTVSHVEANYIRRRGIPGRGSWFTSKRIAGGGALIDIGVHALDLALYLLDYPEVVEVTGQARSEFGTDKNYSYVDMWGEDLGADQFDVDDSATAMVRCADGKTISLEVAWATNRPSNQEFFVRGTDAGALFDKAEGELTMYDSGNSGANHLSTTDVETQSHDPHQEEQAAFLHAVSTGTAPELNTVEEALTVQRVIEAIYESSQTGRAVEVDDSSNLDVELEQTAD